MFEAEVASALTVEIAPHQDGCRNANKRSLLPVATLIPVANSLLECLLHICGGLGMCDLLGAASRCHVRGKRWLLHQVEIPPLCAEVSRYQPVATSVHRNTNIGYKQLFEKRFTRRRSLVTCDALCAMF